MEIRVLNGLPPAIEVQARGLRVILWVGVPLTYVGALTAAENPLKVEELLVGRLIPVKEVPTASVLGLGRGQSVKGDVLGVQAVVADQHAPGFLIPPPVLREAPHRFQDRLGNGHHALPRKAEAQVHGCSPQQEQVELA